MDSNKLLRHDDHEHGHEHSDEDYSFDDWEGMPMQMYCPYMKMFKCPYMKKEKGREDDFEDEDDMIRQRPFHMRPRPYYHPHYYHRPHYHQRPYFYPFLFPYDYDYDEYYDYY